jgi:hypothetical protein
VQCFNASSLLFAMVDRNYLILSIYLSMALQPFDGPCPLFQFLDILHNGTPSTGDQPVAKFYIFVCKDVSIHSGLL